MEQMTVITKRSSPAIGEYQLDDTVKGIPGGTTPFPLSQIAAHKWNVLREDLPLPLLVLKRSELLHNIQVMNAFLQEHQLSIAPHAKTVRLGCQVHRRPRPQLRYLSAELVSPTQ